jgi:lipopolysaccharide/colanic/teichoic acid biosynthesis glycosyltransferase
MFFKRVFDVVISFFSLILFMPLFLMIGIMVRAKLGSPIFFRQQRPGLNGRPFMMIKFRTMTNECDKNGNLLPDSERLPPLGVLLRSMSLDELPEFFNVLKGEMSLVGPRPLLTEYLHLYTERQARRHEVRPGITGWAQINGRNSLSWDEKFELDVWYVENRTFWLDIRFFFLRSGK